LVHWSIQREWHLQGWKVGEDSWPKPMAQGWRGTACENGGDPWLSTRLRSRYSRNYRKIQTTRIMKNGKRRSTGKSAQVTTWSLWWRLSCSETRSSQAPTAFHGAGRPFGVNRQPDFRRLPLAGQLITDGYPISPSSTWIFNRSSLEPLQMLQRPAMLLLPASLSRPVAQPIPQRAEKSLLRMTMTSHPWRRSWPAQSSDDLTLDDDTTVIVTPITLLR